MTIRITTLVENTAGRVRVLAEWGLCMLVETDDCVILSDAGASEAAARNAQVLDVSLIGVNVVVFSHGHFDHTGGLPALLPLMQKPVDIVAHHRIWDHKYAYHPGKRGCGHDVDSDYEYIGIPYERQEAEKLGARFVLGSEPVWLSDTVVTSGEVTMQTEYEDIDSKLMIMEKGEYRPDDLPDDQSIFIKTEKGLVAVLGCAHRGLINHLLRGQELIGSERVHAIVGGTHLMTASQDRIAKTIRQLRQMDVQVIAASHCTGLLAACALERELGESFVFNNAGTCLTF